MPRPLAWTLLMATLWTTGATDQGLNLRQEPSVIHYPELLSTKVIECDCAAFPCDTVYWYRSVSGLSQVQYIGRNNNANRHTYGKGVDNQKFKFNQRSTASFTLTVANVTEEDTGTYSCVLIDKKRNEEWKSGVLLLPGVSPPTEAPEPKPKKPINSNCRCPKKPSQAPNECGSLILWPLVGLIAAIAVALVSTMYYFSRLPKKCRHHFVKKRLMTKSGAYTTSLPN